MGRGEICGIKGGRKLQSINILSINFSINIVDSDMVSMKPLVENLIDDHAMCVYKMAPFIASKNCKSFDWSDHSDQLKHRVIILSAKFGRWGP